MNEEVYLFGAYLSAQQNGQNAWGNFICGFTSMPSFEDLKQEIKVHKDGINDLVIISMQFITREQFYALKG